MDLTRADRSAMSEPESLRAVAGGDGGGEGGDADEDLAAEDARDLPDLPGLPEISRAARIASSSKPLWASKLASKARSARAW